MPISPALHNILRTYDFKGLQFLSSPGKLNLESLFLQFTLNGFPVIALNDNYAILYRTTRSTLTFQFFGNLFQVINAFLKP